MSEICLECWNKINQSNYKAYKYILSKEKELCEECGQLKKLLLLRANTIIYANFNMLFFLLKIFLYFVDNTYFSLFVLQIPQKVK